MLWASYMLRLDMVKRGWILGGAVLGVLVFLALSSFHNRGTSLQELDCDVMTGIERDECLSFFAYGALDDSLCGPIRDSLVKDVCYRDILFDTEFVPLDTFREIDCSAISDPHLQYECASLGSRALMWGVLEERPSPAGAPPEGVPGDCVLYDGHHAALCTSLLAASLAIADLARAESICSRLEDEHQVGECRFLVASAIASNLEESGEYVARDVMGICERTLGLPWRPLCYYELAENLARMRPLAPLKDLALALSAHPAIVEDSGLHGLVRILPPSQREEFCTLLEGPYRSDCSWGLGLSIAEGTGYDAHAGLEQCDTLLPEFREDCLLSVAEHFGALAGSGDFGSPGPDAFSMNAALCDEFEGDFRIQCYKKLTLLTLPRYFLDEGWNLVAAREICESFPADVRGMCLGGTGIAAAGYFVHNLSEAVRACEELAGGLPTDQACFGALSNGILLSTLSDVSKGVGLCTLFPREFREICYVTLAQGNARSDAQDISFWIERCNEFPLLSRGDCFTALAEKTLPDPIQPLNANMSFWLERCADYPRLFRGSCYRVLAEEIRGSFGDTLQRKVRCNQLPWRYRRRCL